MKKRGVSAISVAVVVLVIAPVITYAVFREDSQLDDFLAQRRALLEQLDNNATKLPAGFEHVIPPQASAVHPGNDHIRAVIRNGQQWYGDNHSSYDLRLVGSMCDSAPREILTRLFKDLTSRIGERGFRSSKSGGPDWIVENRRAAHSTWWHNSDRSLLVTISVVVDTASDSAHVTRYVHERFD